VPDGRVLYSLKKRWKDGSTSVVIESQVLMERLCALVPRPRRHLVTYHGVLAPAAGIRPWVVPRVEAEEDGGCRHEGAAADDDEPGIGNDAADDDAVRRLLRHRTVPHRPGKSRRGGRRYPWAELLRRVYMVDVLLCRQCGGKRRLLAAIHDPESVRRVLVAMGLPIEAPVLSAGSAEAAGVAVGMKRAR